MTAALAWFQTKRLRYAPQLTISRPMFPEGISSVFLLVALVTIAGVCIEQAEWSRLVIPVSVIALGSAVFGAVTAKLRMLDSLAHMLAMLTGVAVVLAFVTDASVTLGDTRRDRLQEFGRIGMDWYLGRPVPEEMVAYLVSMLMGLIVWLVGYLSAWSLFRRGWVLVGVGLPGFMILVNLGYASEPDSRFLAAYAVVGLVLLARYSLHQRQREWRRDRLPGPSGLASRFFLIGLVVALLSTSLGWQSPASMSQRAFHPLMDEITMRAQSAQDTIGDLMESMPGSSEQGQVPQGGSYTAFDDAFSIGGPLSLTDEPQVLVFADRAPYLSAQHYDTYSGRGWYSTTEGTFEPQGADGRRYAPEMTFGVNQTVPLSEEVSAGRTTSAVEIAPLGPASDHMLTVDTYVSSSLESTVRMSWVQLDGVEFDMPETNVLELPRDVQRIAFLLLSSQLTGEDAGAGPAATDPVLRDGIEAERSQLQARFLTVRWEADGNGDLSKLVVTGQVPVYDDVEAVFYRNRDDSGERYRVISASSRATPSDLRTAGTDYPDWVAQRYLSLPETITPRTVGLTETITAAAGNPFDRARAVEQYLRSEIIYDETVQAPPAEWDIADYLLFERNRGYCEYTATAMAVMLRSISVPARVAVGFYPGDYDDAQGGYLYLHRNAHAWVEVFFPGYGWIPFEPTSSQSLIPTGQETLPEMPEPVPTEVPGVVEEVVATPATDATLDAGVPDNEVLPPQPTLDSGSGGPGWLVPAAIGLGIATLAGAALWLLWAVPLRGLSPAASLFVRMRRVGGMLGVRPGTNVTPGEFGQAFAHRVPQARPHVRRIVESYELDEYGPMRPGRDWLQPAEDAWRSLYRHLPAWLVGRPRR